MILIGTDGGIYRWVDGCGWPIFHSLQGRRIVGLEAPGAGVLLALDRTAMMFESVNNGLDWRTIPLAEGAGEPTALAVWGTSSASVVVLATARPLGLYRRAVGAPIPRLATPSTRARHPLVERASTLAVGATELLVRRRAEPVDPQTARAAGWTLLGVPQGTSGTEIRTLECGWGETAPWFAAVRGAGLWRSADAGASWQRCDGLPDDVYVIRPSRERPASVWAGTSHGCWQSNDGGLSWEDRSGGLGERRFVSALDAKPGAPDTLLAGVGPFAPEAAGANVVSGVGYALYESTNGGKAWTHVTKRNHPEVIERDAIVDIRYDPATPDTIVDALSSGEIRLTRNDGAYWSPIARQIREARVLCGSV